MIPWAVTAGAVERDGRCIGLLQARPCTVIDDVGLVHIMMRIIFGLLHIILLLLRMMRWLLPE